MITVNYKNLDAWLFARRASIGASEAAAVLGVSQYGRTALSVYNDKKHPGEPVDNDLFWWGHAMERPTAAFFHRKTGIELGNFGDYAISHRDGEEWLTATLDRVTDSEEPVELKYVTTGISVDEWEACPPIDNEIQLQVQMYVTGAKRGYLVASGFRYGALGIIEMERNDRFLKYAVPKIKQFFEESILMDKMPEPTADKDKREVQKTFNIADGKTIELTDAELKLANEWEQTRDEIKKLNEKKDSAITLLKWKLGSNSFGKLPDGTYLTNKPNKRGNRVLRRTRRFY